MQGVAGVGGEDGQWQQVLVTAGPNVWNGQIFR